MKYRKNYLLEPVPAVGQLEGKADIESRCADTKTIISGVNYTVESLLHPDFTTEISRSVRKDAKEAAKKHCSNWEEKSSAEKTAIIEALELRFWERFAPTTDKLVKITIRK